MRRGRVLKWVRTMILGGLGGGIAAMVATLSDPQKYRFPHDLGTGKMWPYFFSGAAMTIGGIFLKSPLAPNPPQEKDLPPEPPIPPAA